jgi:serine phosphatase RsbU (regulator of sigma subunit)
MKRLFILFVFLFLSNSFFSQTCSSCIDSLRKIINENRQDTIAVSALSNRMWQYYDLDTSKVLLDDALVLAKNLKHDLWVARVHFFIAYYYKRKILSDEAIKHFLIALEIFDKKGDKSRAAKTRLALAYSFLDQELDLQAKENIKEALKIYEELNDSISIADCLGSLANIYPLSEYKESVALYERAISVYKQFPSDANEKKIAIAQGNIANKLIGNKVDLTKARKVIKEANELWNKIGSYGGVAYNDVRLGEMFLYLKKPDSAIFHLKRCYYYAKKNNWMEMIDMSYLFYSEALFQKNLYKEAYEVLKLGTTINDSLYKTEKKEEMIKISNKYKEEKAARERELEAALNEAMQREKEAKSKNIRNMLLLGLGIVLIFSIILFNRFKKIKQQKELIEDTHSQLEQKNQEILDSISYAKRIQGAILPPVKLFKQHLHESFILYKPKDIVAGDFYWMEHKDGKVLFAAADCTGHGVPGAMVSVVCNNGLNRSVREYGLIEPGKILDKTREIVIAEFEKSEEEVKDGMDIALCSLEGNKLQYAGANNPLWIIRNQEIIEIKADKQPIGKYAENKTYTTHNIELQKGDSIYIFTDGYADQFGGEKSKKFKAANFKKLLLSIQKKPMEEQKNIIEQGFKDWKGNLEQIDDVCIIGVRA